MDDLADQVQLLFYHDMHFNVINMQMHTKLNCEMKQGLKSSELFKIDTGVNGSLMPIMMFVKLFPNISLETLGKLIESKVTLFAYNNTPIKQFEMCTMKISFKGKHKICKFYVDEFSTVIIGVNDSEELGLVKVNFDMLEKSSMCQTGPQCNIRFIQKRN